MLHLFNKVYIDTDYRIDIHLDRIVISDTSGVPMYEALDKVSNGYLLMYGKTLEEVLENNNLAGFDSLIEFVYNRLQDTDRQIIFYLDDVTFAKFISIWFKKIFLDIDIDTAWNIVDSYRIRDLGSPGVDFIRMGDEVFPDTNVIYPNLTQEKFQEIFNSINIEEEPRHEIYNTIKSGLSLEYLIASYLYNGSFSHELSGCLKTILLRTLQDSILEIKSTAYRHHNVEPFQTKIDQKFFYDSSVFKMYPVGYVGKNSSADLLTSSDEDINTLKNICKTVYLEWDKFSPESSMVKMLDLIDIVRKDIDNSAIDTILNFEKNIATTNRIYADDDRGTINSYLLHNVLHTEPSELRRLLLR